jgi:hypothetical protein
VTSRGKFVFFPRDYTTEKPAQNGYYGTIRKHQFEYFTQFNNILKIFDFDQSEKDKNEVPPYMHLIVRNLE